MACIDGFEDWRPLVFDRGAVGVQLDLEAGVEHHPFAGSDVGRQICVDPDRRTAEIDGHLHPNASGGYN